MAMAAVCYGVDASIVSGLSVDNLPGDIRKAVQLSEAFAHGISVTFILTAVLLATRGVQQRMVWIAVLTTLLSGVTANVLKGSFVRIRPHSVGKIVVEGAGTDGGIARRTETVAASFWDSRQRSFPSGHAATAWGLAIGLSLAFPRATIIFCMLAVLACLQRIVSGAHFASDVFAGTAIACFCSWVLLAHSKLRQILVDSHLQLAQHASQTDELSEHHSASNAA